MAHLLDEATKEQLIEDFKRVVVDAEALLKATASHGGDEIDAVRARAEASLKVVKGRLSEAQTALLASTREAAKATAVYVHENPWAALGLAAGVGLLVGLLNGRR